jgi:hypothetical protein
VFKKEEAPATHDETALQQKLIGDRNRQKHSELSMTWLEFFLKLISVLSFPVLIGVAVLAVQLVCRTKVIRRTFPRTFRQYRLQILKQELQDLCHTVPGIAAVVSKVLPPSGRIKRVYDPDSTDLTEAWELLAKAKSHSPHAVPSDELEDLQEVRRWLRESFLAAEHGPAEVERYFLLAKVGPAVVAFAYYQYFPLWRMSFVSYFGGNTNHPHYYLGKEKLRVTLATHAATTKGLRAIIFETSDLKRYRLFRPFLGLGGTRRIFKILDLPNFRQPPISPEECRTVVPGLLVCYWAEENERVESLTRDQVLELLDFTRYHYREAYRDNQAFFESLEEWHRNVTTDLPERIALLTNGREIRQVMHGT